MAATVAPVTTEASAMAQVLYRDRGQTAAMRHACNYSVPLGSVLRAATKATAHYMQAVMAAVGATLCSMGGYKIASNTILSGLPEGLGFANWKEKIKKPGSVRHGRICL